MEEIVLDESHFRPCLSPGALDHEIKRSLSESDVEMSKFVQAGHKSYSRPHPGLVRQSLEHP